MSKILRIATLLCVMLSASPTFARHLDDPATRLAKVIGDRVPGKPTDCISLSEISSSQIVDGKAIVYRSGSRLYVNDPRSGTDLLEDDDILVTHPTGSQLCSIDTVTLVDRSSRIPKGFVILGQFVPYERFKTPR